MERDDDDDAIDVERLVLGDLLNHVLDKGVVITGTWTDINTPTECTTTDTGRCTFASDHFTRDAATVERWTVTGVTKAGAGRGTDTVSTLSCSRSDDKNGTTVCG